MPTRRYKLSDKNPYKIPHYKALELRYFCLQYPAWKKEYRELNLSTKGLIFEGTHVQTSVKSRVEDISIRLQDLSYKIKLVEDTVHTASPEIEKWLLKGVTTETNYNELLFMDGIPCCEKQYYNIRRKFFWLLSRER